MRSNWQRLNTKKENGNRWKGIKNKSNKTEAVKMERKKEMGKLMRKVFINFSSRQQNTEEWKNHNFQDEIYSELSGSDDWLRAMVSYVLWVSWGKWGRRIVVWKTKEELQSSQAFVWKLFSLLFSSFCCSHRASSSSASSHYCCCCWDVKEMMVIRLDLWADIIKLNTGHNVKIWKSIFNQT